LAGRVVPSPAGGDEVDFSILGPLEVHDHGGAIRIAGARLRSLLILLLVNRNEVLSSDRILDALWPEGQPASGRAALQARVAALRRGIGADRIETREPGYVLRVGVDELDADRFERLVAEGRRKLRADDPVAAAPTLSAALALWRGEPLLDVAYAPFAQAEIQRLSGLYLGAVEDHVEARLAVADPSELVDELEGLVQRHPFRERLHGQLITALYRAGRQADALAAYQDARRTLAEELGIEPGPALQDLQRAVLAQDPGLLASAGQVTEPSPEHRRTVTVMLLDPEPMDDQDPELDRARREHVSATTRRIVEQHGGSLHRVAGNRVLATFGLPTVHEDDALRAIRAAMELSHADKPAPRIAIATGEIVAGGDRGWDVDGRPVTDAERLLGAAKSGHVLLGHGTRALIRSSVQLRPIDSGDAWLVEGLIAGSQPGGDDTRFVGRDHELAQLLQAFGRARDHRTVHLVTVIAPPGIGKSRLAREFTSVVGDQASVLVGHCPAYGEGVTFWPIAEILSRLTRDRPLAEILGGEIDAERIEARLGGVTGAAGAEIGVQEVFWAVRRLVETLGRERPLLLVVEDIHWAEPTMLTLLEYLTEWTIDTPVVLICLARPELLERAPAWAGGRVNALTILLEPLTGAESAALVGSLPVAQRLSGSLRGRIQDLADGNPLFLEQIVAHMVEQGVSDSEIRIPPTIQALLAARIEQLATAERSALERASILGSEFAMDALSALQPPGTAPHRSADLRALAAKEFLRTTSSRAGSEPSYRFRHVLLQQSAYAGMTRSLRAELHERYADWLDSSGGERTLETDELIGYHLEQAVHHRREIGDGGERTSAIAGRAGARLAAAGHRAFTSGDMGAAVGLLRRAGDLLPVGDRTRLDTLPDLAGALFETGQLRDAIAVLNEASTVALEVGDQRTIWRAAVQTRQLGLYIEPGEADVDELLNEVGEAARVLEGLGDRLGAARAWRTLSDLHLMQGRVRTAERACRRATEHAAAVSSRRERAWSIGQLGFCSLWGPTRVSTVLRRLREVLRSAAGDPLLEANVLGFLAVAEMMAGRSDAARADMARGRAMTRALGLTWQGGFHETLAADMERISGNPAGAEPLFRSAMTILLDQGDRWTASIASIDLASVLLDLGRVDEALELIDAAGVMPVSGDAEWRFKRAAVGGRALARLDRPDDGLALAQEAAADVLRTEYVEHQGTVLLGLAEVQAACGRATDARASAISARDTFDRKGDRASAERARQFAAQLG
jgi:DNA-binding SARP family transcriptional activator